MKKILLPVVFAASSSAAAAESGIQVLMVRGAGNSTCAQYLEASKQGPERAAPFEQWLEGYITARNQTNPEVLDYGGVVGHDEVIDRVAKFCKGHLNAKYYEAADSLLSDLAKAGKVKYTR